MMKEIRINNKGGGSGLAKITANATAGPEVVIDASKSIDSFSQIGFELYESFNHFMETGDVR